LPIRTIAIPVAAWLPPASRVGPPVYDPAAVTVAVGTNFDGFRANFDDTLPEFLMTSFMVPDNYSGTRNLVISWLSNTAVVGTVRWGVSTRPIPDDGTWDDTFGVGATSLDTVSGILGDISQANIDLVGQPAWTSGEVVQLVLQRTGTGSMIGDASMVLAHILVEVVEQDYTMMASTENQDGAAGTLGVGQFAFNPTDWSTGAAFHFGATFSVTNAARVGSVSLYNLTDAEFVTGTSFTSSGLSFAKQESAALTVGVAAGNLKDTEKIYEVRMSITGGDPLDLVALGTAYMRVI